MITFKLSFNNEAESLWLPVPPQSFEIQTGLNNTTVNIHELGEAVLIGKRRLKSVSLSSYFPIADDGLYQYADFPPPAKCIETIERWRDSKRPIRLKITGESVKFNEAMTIENFNYSQRKGPQDVYFTLDLREYRFLQAKTVPGAGGQSPVSKASSARPADRTPPKTYTVQSGDTLMKIAQKVYGDSGKWKALKENNNIKDERKLRIGAVLNV
ncbi:hypothetical protein PAE9249_03578 [Paenibacillus sp. CECT 9249]|uniref:LysM peptidoglycan-binding domain-containing protein n=1 Tax=Paenibacillus sp. CECT 9249 TaxID=2845385 RepID=UPI001E457E0B|nr:LysM peptidoglycan-binding domain-containing protein [Paenibacillus sp. CECT 9249]CAH0121052.1 hypothetical protein PAE9249_03578 [Paenibacillus sp. CECT 9249]